MRKLQIKPKAILLAVLAFTVQSYLVGQSGGKSNVFKQAKEKTKGIIKNSEVYELVSFDKISGQEISENTYILDCSVVCKPKKTIIRGGQIIGDCGFYYHKSMQDLDSYKLSKGKYYKVYEGGKITIPYRFVGRKLDSGWQLDPYAMECHGNTQVETGMWRSLTTKSQAEAILVTAEMRKEQKRKKELKRRKMRENLESDIMGSWAYANKSFTFNEDRTFVATVKNMRDLYAGDRYYAGTWGLSLGSLEQDPKIELRWWTNSEKKKTTSYTINLNQSHPDRLMTHEGYELDKRKNRNNQHDYVWNCIKEVSRIHKNNNKPTFNPNDRIAFLEYMAIGNWHGFSGRRKVGFLELNKDKTATYSYNKTSKKITGKWNIRVEYNSRKEKKYYLDINDIRNGKRLKSFDWGKKPEAYQYALYFKGSGGGTYWRDLTSKPKQENNNSFAKKTSSRSKGSTKAKTEELTKGKPLMNALLGTWISEDKKTVWRFTMKGCTRTKNGKKQSGIWYYNPDNGYLEYKMKGITGVKLPLGFVKIKGDKMTFRRMKDFAFTRIN